MLAAAEAPHVGTEDVGKHEQWPIRVSLQGVNWSPNTAISRCGNSTVYDTLLGVKRCWRSLDVDTSLYPCSNIGVYGAASRGFIISIYICAFFSSRNIRVLSSVWTVIRWQILGEYTVFCK